MEALQKSGSAAWKDLEAGLKSAMNRLGQSIDRVAGEFK
jgi:hypothetical protein